MPNSGVKETAGNKIEKITSVYSGFAKDSQGVEKPVYLQQPDVITLPTAAPQRQENPKTVATQSVVSNNSSSKGE
jgi:hypothetical protein